MGKKQYINRDNTQTYKDRYNMQTDTICKQTIHKHIQYTNRYNTQTETIPTLIQYTNIYDTQTYATHRDNTQTCIIHIYNK